jgi:hypothetical protein
LDIFSLGTPKGSFESLRISHFPKVEPSSGQILLLLQLHASVRDLGSALSSKGRPVSSCQQGPAHECSLVPSHSCASSICSPFLIYPLSDPYNHPSLCHSPHQTLLHILLTQASSHQSLGNFGAASERAAHNQPTLS